MPWLELSLTPSIPTSVAEMNASVKRELSNTFVAVILN
jgi:hypothetical protein